jgi:glycosyltransferase involved in cell wall biosynthesis
MNILMVTNTFTPHVGGVARSVQGFTSAFRARGHRVLVLAPVFPGMPAQETDVVRIPAVQRFNGSDFSVPVPVPRRVAAALKPFPPQLVHSHHPFLLGDTALRIAAARGVPMVFTHHTIYERYTHYVPGDSPRLKHFVMDLVTGYCNLCDAVIAPSESVARLLRERGVVARIEVIPTGVDVQVFARGDGSEFRRRMGIPLQAFVVGHVGRLAPEKNLGFLAEAVSRFLRTNDQAYFLVAGTGPSQEVIQQTFAVQGVADRLRVVGVLGQKELAAAYRAFDVFAFASQTETQGMVLTEALAAGIPVVAVDAPGVREVVRDRDNGRLLLHEDIDAFVTALRWVASLTPAERQHLREGITRTAAEFSMDRTANRTLALYESLIGVKPQRKPITTSVWAMARRRIAEEWKILRNIVHAAGGAVLSLSREVESGETEAARR